MADPCVDCMTCLAMASAAQAMAADADILARIARSQGAWHHVADKWDGTTYPLCDFSGTWWTLRPGALPLLPREIINLARKDPCGDSSTSTGAREP